MYIFRKESAVLLAACVISIFAVTAYAVTSSVKLAAGNSYTITVSGSPANITGNVVKVLKGKQYHIKYKTYAASGWVGQPASGNVPVPGTATVTFRKKSEDDISDTITVQEETMLVTITVAP